ncbi:MAG: hypothetical protein LBQ60_12170 [Bacteroidales bacterium]|jgi:hypothetical protein|nr:hypothetical protein [Bacteroidales bacterium]
MDRKAFFLFLLLVAVFSGCKESPNTGPEKPEEPEGPPTESSSISIKPESAMAQFTKSETNVVVTASGKFNVQIPEADKSWISVRTQTLSTVILSIAENTSETERTSIVVFNLTDTDKQAEFTLTQDGYISPLTIDPTEKTVSFEAQDFSVNVTASKPWNVTVPTWITEKEKTGNSIILSVGKNTSRSVRTATITFRQDSEPTAVTLAFKQEGDENGDGSPEANGYTLMGVIEPAATLIGSTNSQLHNNWLRGIGFDYSEYPNCDGLGGHRDGVHLAIENDATLNKPVMRFDIHITPVIDSDRCGTFDRQRNEMKSQTSATWAKLNGNWDEWQIMEWKFKIPVGFQPTGSFCHIHQLKAQESPNNGAPVITITPRANSSGGNKRIQVIHAVDGASTGLGTLVDNIPLSEFEGEWVQVVQEVHYTHNGYYGIVITRIRDGKVLINYQRENIDMWRIGATNIRSKWGIYRSLAGGNLNNNPVGQSSLLKNESIWMCDFKVYEKNSNPNPQPHD